jgi:hypothetical protein
MRGFLSPAEALSCKVHGLVSGVAVPPRIEPRGLGRQHRRAAFDEDVATGTRIIIHIKTNLTSALKADVPTDSP